MKERYLASKQEKGKFYQLSSHTQCGFSVSVKLLCNGILTVCFHHKAFLFDIIVKKKTVNQRASRHAYQHQEGCPFSIFRYYRELRFYIPS